MENNTPKCFCGRGVYKDDKCILHCEKVKGLHRDKGIVKFHNALIEYIIKDLQYMIGFESSMHDELKAYLGNRDNNLLIYNENIKSFVAETPVHLGGIFFPDTSGTNIFDFRPILSKLGKIEFYRCEFLTSSLILSNTSCFFDECTFYDAWFLYSIKILENIRGVLYQYCNFKENVFLLNDNKTTVFDIQLFSDCTFEAKIEFYDIHIKGKIFDNSPNATEYRNNNCKARQIGKLVISNCVLNDKFILNDTHISNLEIKDTIFENRVEMQNNYIGEVEIINTNFKKLVDCFGSEFDKFQIEKSIFDEFVGFEKCKLGVKNNSNKEYVAVFQYATFLSFVNFRDAKFHSGLDLRNINLKETPNFLGVNIEDINTNRETYRIIKASLDKQANYIEANEFYSLEMKAMEKELSSKYCFEKILLVDWYVFKIGGWASKHSQSWWRPFWLMGVISVFFFCVSWEQDFWQFINPFSTSVKYKGFELGWWIAYKAIFAFLLYHFIVSLRRNTKR